MRRYRIKEFRHSTNRETGKQKYEECGSELRVAEAVLIRVQLYGI